ncbi:serine O-acetyltransferase [Aggregicoccus sp. 17bor-14]|uniref:serine O-acetyltransferase n=1 Tax=Myxococcaceae TaxID=31 RepID=UPI00351AA686
MRPEAPSSPTPRLSARARFHADLSRYLGARAPGTRLQRLGVLLRTEPLWALATFRFGQYLHEEASRPVRLLCKLPFALAHRAVSWGLGIHLYPQTQVGPGLYIGHWGGIWVSPHARIGAHCNVNHAVTIGCAGEGERGPELADRVWVGPSATITGPVKVGEGAVIGANSLVVANVPPQAVVVGVPARAVSYTGSARLLEPRTPGASVAQAAAAVAPETAARVQVGPGPGPNRAVVRPEAPEDPLRPAEPSASPAVTSAPTVELEPPRPG